LKKAKDIREALSYVERSAYTKKQLFTYDRVRDVIMTRRTIVVDSVDKGIEIGRQAEKRDIAKNMKASGIPLSQISKITGLSVEEIKRL
jgi:predicted transposase/invertase (TIGR01784 family)